MTTAELLERYPVFEGLPAQIAEAIQEEAEIAPYAPGEVIVPFGQPFTFFGVILQGEVSVYLPEQEGEPRSIQTLRAGDTIGEMSLLTGLEAPVDLIATSPCRLLLIPVDLFQRWVGADPGALQRFSKSIAKRPATEDPGAQPAHWLSEIPVF
jgi:CRP-like cAMP-binding protein